MLLKLFYNCGLAGLTLIWLPKFLLGRITGKYKQTVERRLGLKIGSELNELRQAPKRVWIHSCSVGETKAAGAFAVELKKRYPSISIVVSTTTETGQAEALRQMPFADAHFLLPLDFSWVMRRLVRLLRPSLLILVESEFWLNLIREAKMAHASVVLINGKLSDRSAARFSKVPFFSSPLFSSFDYCCLQTTAYQQSFLAQGVASEKIKVTGNLKFDSVIHTLAPHEIARWQEDLGLQANDKLLVLASTHDQEEESLLNALLPLLESHPRLKLLVAPRHPPRFDDVAKLMQKYHLPFMRYTERANLNASQKSQSRLILIDTMGQLMNCFQLASLAIVAGSFIPGIGGHNLFEPASVGVPVIFGPYVDGQKAYADALVEANGGISLSSENVSSFVSRLLSNEEERVSMGRCALDVVNRSRGAVARTLTTLEKFLK